ncbi:hypothetical protein K488DRAFT_75017 [Vararia minispora EC-137]|uniref:Uncharacterized protein n=1 Tax=Vararia minispora EC-137 TaxID=1314806 RepID=A0ACB8Q507_9AGAM|nr:hypothetical protein K488DRAFT_75017 [Vararia minispora EC-137]
MSKQRHTFIVWAPDRIDPDALARRLAVRPQHLVRAHELHARGVILTGGPMRPPESITPGASVDAQNAFVGSTMIVAASSLEEARAVVEGDLYYTSNVWDKEKLTILPYSPSLPWPANEA